MSFYDTVLYASDLNTLQYYISETALPEERERLTENANAVLNKDFTKIIIGGVRMSPRRWSELDPQSQRILAKTITRGLYDDVLVKKLELLSLPISTGNFAKAIGLSGSDIKKMLNYNSQTFFRKQPANKHLLLRLLDLAVIRDQFDQVYEYLTSLEFPGQKRYND